MKQILSIIVLLAFFNTNQSYAQAWEVTVANVGELDGRIENFVDLVQATVKNPGPPRDAHFLLNIRRDDIGLDISNSSFLEDHTFTVTMSMPLYTVRSIATQLGDASFEDFDFGSPPPGYEDYIRDHRRLPPGDYVTCLTVYDAEEVDLPILGTSCLNFTIYPRDAPIIQNPQDISSGAWILGSDPVSFPVMWIHPMVFNEKYSLEIKNIGDHDAVASFNKADHAAFDALSNAILPETEIEGYIYNVTDDDVIELEEGDFIAIRVTADASVNQYHNQGRSNIVVAAFGVPASNQCEHPNFFTNVVWPAPGDTLPFRNIHYVVEFDPLCSELRQFDATFSTSSQSGSEVRRTSVDNIWRVHGGGPYHFLENLADIKDLPLDWVLPDSSYAQQLPLIHSTDSDLYNPVVPNENGYRMSGNVSYTYYDRAVGSEQVQTQALSEFVGQSFHIGMPTPELISPPHNDTLNLGDITFRFNTGQVPSDALPDFQILKIDGSTITNPYLNVQEKLVLQIASDPLFPADAILFDGLRTIQASSGHPDVSLDWESPSFSSLPTDSPIEQTPDRLYREDDFLNQVYKRGDLTFNFTEEDTVWWRVVWLRAPQDINTTSPTIAEISISETDIYNVSAVRRLLIKEGAPDSPGDEEEDGGCESVCEIDPITNTSPLSTLANGDIFFAGQFEVTVGALTNSGSSFSGTGTISIPILNDVNLMVRFDNIKVNTDRKMFIGKVTAIQDASPFRINTDEGSELPYIDEDDVEVFNDWMNEASRLVSFLTGEPIGLPVGLDREIDGRQVILGMVAAEFGVLSSNVTFVSGFEIPEINTYISVGAKDICLSPTGFKADSINLFLPFDQGVDFKNVAMLMKGGMMESELDEISYITYNCNGFKRAKIAIECKFPRSMLIPDAGGIPSTDESERVSFFSSARYDLGEGLMLRFNLDPFYVAGADNLRFRLEEAYLDLSAAINPPSIVFPDNYEHTDTLPTGAVSNAWQGFYMKTLSMEFADDLIDTRDATIAVKDFIIDGHVTLKIGVYDIIDDGKIRNWKATLDTIQLSITQSELDDFRVKGKIQPPIADDGEYLNYGLVFDFEADNNYYLQVDVEDSLRVPMVVANMSLNGDSYIRAGRNDTRGAYITANFSGQITIADEYAPDLSSIPGMTIPGIRFEDFKLDSDEGVSCTNWDFAGLTGSPATSGPGLAPPLLPLSDDDDQGFAAGFPLTIDSMGLGGGLTNPHLYIKANLNFQQGDNGISAGCGLQFNATFEDEGDGQKFRLDGVDLRGIYVLAEFSAMAIEGSLEWEKSDTKEEIKGALEVRIPTGVEVTIGAIFGTVKENELAPYNSPLHYNYWMVNGAVKLGKSGVPICSGIAMYGIGGGVWHHMKLKEGQRLMSSRATLSAPDAMSSISPASFSKFENDFDNILGLNFNVLLGVQNSSSTVNMEVGLTAEYSSSLGLELLRIEGAVYVMQEMGAGEGEDEGGMLYGEAMLEYRYSSGPSFIGEIDVWLDIAGVVKGAVDNNNKLADVNFYADGEEWYFHMGSYDASTRVITPGAAIKLTMGETELARASTYMMVGHRVPLELPLPPANVRDLLGMDSQSNDDAEVNTNEPAGPSDVDYITGQRDEDGSYNTGEGFAFGSTVSASVDIDAFIYFYLGLTVGFDVNITQADYECLGIGKPGFDGWYAQGQAYAALEGELGIKFKFFGTRKIQLLYLGVAMMLEAKLANPNYFKGTAGVRFSVLGGAFEGRKVMKFEFGEKCDPLIKDPLANINFIEKIEPNQSMRDVSVFETPSVFFNFPMDRDLLLPKALDAETGLPTAYYRFRPFVSEFSVKNATAEIDNQEVAGSDKYTPDRKILQRVKDDAFAGHTRYNVKCVVKVRDHSIDAPHLIYRDDSGRQYLDKKEVYFTTGDYPDILPEENVKYTYPLQKQRFFLQNETNKKGTIALKEGMGSSSGSGAGLFYAEADGVEYEYELRITKATDFEDSQSMPISYTSGRYIPIDLPPLENEEMYIAQVIRTIKVTQSETDTGNPLLFTSSGLSYSELQNTLARQTIRTKLTQNSLGYSELVVSRLTPESLIKYNETKLFEFFFQTSKYNSISQKLNGIDLASKTPSIGPHSHYNNIADVDIQLEEGFDVFDLYGYRNDGNLVVSPLVKFTDPLLSDYWMKHGLRSTFFNISRLSNFEEVDVQYRFTPLMNNNGTYHIEGNWPNEDYSYPYTREREMPRSYYLVSNRNFTHAPLSDGALDFAIEENYEEDAPVASESTVSPHLGFGLSESGGAGASVNSGLFGGSSDFNSSASVSYDTDNFFNGNGDKLLLHYDLSKQAFLKWSATKIKINSFYYLRNNVRIEVHSGIYSRHNLLETVGHSIQNNPSTYRGDVAFVRNKSYSNFNYVTTPYISRSELGNQNVSNRYHVRFRYHSPTLRSGAAQTHFPIMKTHLMTRDPSRIPDGPE